MIGAVEIHVPLDLLEMQQDGIPIPSFGAAFRPLVEVGRRAPIGKLPVDGRAPPSTRACSYLRNGGRSSSGLLCETTWVVTFSSFQ